MKKFLALFAIAAITIPAARADPRFQAHANLLGAAEQAGVSIHFNHPKACDDAWGGGFYSSRYSAIMICQDDGEGVGNGNLVPMTPNDADTLRHEAHHVVQGCIDGRLDGELDTLFVGEELKEFVKKGLPQSKILWIIETYGKQGADEEAIILELEAFAVAASVDPDNIAIGLKRKCSSTSRL